MLNKYLTDAETYAKSKNVCHASPCFLPPELIPLYDYLTGIYTWIKLPQSFRGVPPGGTLKQSWQMALARCSSFFVP